MTTECVLAYENPWPKQFNNLPGFTPVYRCSCGGWETPYHPWLDSPKSATVKKRHRKHVEAKGAPR